MSDDIDEVDRDALARMFPRWEVDEWVIYRPRCLVWPQSRYLRDDRGVSRGITVTTGEELPGSWHQQINGGVREWVAVSGEIEVAS